MTQAFLSITPRAKGRPRFSARGGFVRAYTDAETREYESALADAWRKIATGDPLTGAVEMTISLHLPIPAGWSKRKRAQAAEGDIRPTTKPDADNYAKAVLDALNGIAYADDAQIVDLSIRKRYSEHPGLLINVDEAMQAIGAQRRV